MKKNKWSVNLDGDGYACGIAFDGWTILHLNPGTTRNEDNAKKMVDYLNGFGDIPDIANYKRPVTHK